MYKGSIGSLLLASFAAGGIILLNLWIQYGPFASVVLSADRTLVTFFGAAATFGLATAVAEQFAQLSERRQLWPSALGGIFAFALAFAVWGGIETFEQARLENAGSMVLLVVAIIGALLGFAHFALGDPRERRLPDDPDILARALAEKPGRRAQAAADRAAGKPGSAFSNLLASAPRPSGPAVVETPDRLYFSGPVQVRTSHGALFFSGALVALLFILIVLGGVVLVGAQIPGKEAMSYWGAFDRAGLGQWLIFGTLGFSALLYVPNLFAHNVARWLKITSGGGYATAGLLASIVLCFVIPPLGIIALFPCPLAMMLYRRMVGLEPVDLPADLVVEKTDALVGADHPRRHYRRVLVQD